MVKIRILTKEYDWHGNVRKITAKVSYNKWSHYKGYDIYREWSVFCDEIRRLDIWSKKTNHKYYLGVKQKAEKQLEELKERENKEKTREQRRQNCACKEKCLAEFECSLKE